MAGDWLKMECCLPEKPEVFQIAGITGLDPDEVFGKLFKVWRWFDAHTESGNAPGVTYALVDRIAGVTGFAEAMAFAGWLVQDGSTLVVPNFDRHNGKTAKERALTAKRVAKSKGKSNGSGNGQVTVEALPREEKRREEKKEDNNPSDCLSSADDCPHAEIVKLYHEILPANPRMKVWNGQRAKHLRTRWREEPKRQSLDYWRRFFEKCAASRFLTGQTAGKDGRAFLPGLDWLILPSNFAKVIEGRYDD